MPYRFDETDPHLLVVYTGTEHDIGDERNFMARWVTRFNQADRFGVIMVNEPHQHYERDEDEEAQVVRLMNDFRRNHRHQSHQKTIAYAYVYDANAEWIKAYDAAAWEQLQRQINMRTNYMYGTRGRIFTSVDDAKAWVKSQANLPPIKLDEAPTLPPETGRVGLFYGSTTGVTEHIAYKIQAVWQAKQGEELTPINVGRVQDLSKLLAYDHLILGVPTWNIGQLQDDWDISLPQLAMLDFTGKQIALFGIGDQYYYPDNFLDALGILGNQLRECGARLVGFTESAGYEFAESRGLEDGKFMGLGIDEVHQSNLTDERIANWVTQITQEFALQATR